MLNPSRKIDSSLSRGQPCYISVNDSCVRSTVTPSFHSDIFGHSVSNNINVCYNNMTIFCHTTTFLIPDNKLTISAQEAGDKYETQFTSDKGDITGSLDRQQGTSSSDNGGDKFSKPLSTHNSRSALESASDTERSGPESEVSSNKEPLCPGK